MFSRTTPVVRNLIIINVIVFIAQQIIPYLTEYIALWGIQTSNFKPYQLFTYMFAHSSFFHILFNMLVLNSIGPILEEFWGQKKFLVFYTAAGIGAAIFNILMNLFFGLGYFDVMTGASGAIYGILTAFGVIFANMEMRLMFIPVSFKAKYLVMVLGVIAIYSGFRGSAGDNTAHFAHLGGIVVAIILLQFNSIRGRN